MLGGKEFAKKRLNLEKRLETIPGESKEAIDLLRGMLAEDPEDRWYFHRVVQHPWFRHHAGPHIAVLNLDNVEGLIQYSEDLHVEPGNWVVLESVGPRIMYTIPNEQFQRRYDARPGMARQPARGRVLDDNARYARHRRMMEYSDNAPMRLLMKVGPDEMALLWEYFRDHQDFAFRTEADAAPGSPHHARIAPGSRVPTQLAMVEFIERYILDPERGPAIERDSPEAFNHLFQVYNYEKAAVYARQVLAEDGLEVVWKYHNPGGGGRRAGEVFAFQHKPWPNGEVTHDPVTEGDYLCYIPSDNEGSPAEVYQVEASTVSEDGSGDSRCKYFRKCIRLQRTLREGDGIRAMQWFQGCFDSRRSVDFSRPPAGFVMPAPRPVAPPQGMFTREEGDDSSSGEEV